MVTSIKQDFCAECNTATLTRICAFFASFRLFWRRERRYVPFCIVLAKPAAKSRAAASFAEAPGGRKSNA